MTSKNLRILRPKLAAQKVGLSITSVNEMSRQGLFPRAVQMTPKTRGFLEHEIDAWIASRVKLRDSGDPSTDPILNANLARV
ncbi:hypothetical protein SuNHUV7_22270 (plasmid) [Pseudoseohaeicola sp. NH-UV-7]|uniref:helix-turn-helix transcriptional regulator n=1 Tax=Sulfitobacter sp. TBRI5 TaxID=2989732 RepID=UPI003A776925